MSAAPRVVLFGLHGQVGSRLAASLDAAGYEVAGIDRARCDFLVADEKNLATILRAVEPALIVNAAAYTDVDGAQTHAPEAMRVNAEIPALLARWAAEHDARLLHFSTDYVFGGGGHAPYGEQDAPQPVNRYGISKRAGEEAVLAAGAHVFRLQWVYDVRGRNFLTAIQPRLAQDAELRVVADQLGAPSPAAAIAQAVARAVPLILHGELPPGPYHLAAQGHTSWHGFACAIAAHRGSASRIVPVLRAEYGQAAPRPADTRLDCRTLAAYGIALPHWRDAFAMLMREDHATA